MGRCRIKQTTSLETRLAEQAQQLRQEAKGTPPGFAWEQLLRRARHAEAAAQMQGWLGSPVLRPPS